MIYYYIGRDLCIYIYNSNTDHWIVKSPKVIYNNSDILLDSLNYEKIKPIDNITKERLKWFPSAAEAGRQL